jgi:coniferyl-aldehyde dehydrogenase
MGAVLHPFETGPETETRRLLELQRRAASERPYPTLDERREDLNRLERLVAGRKEAIADAVSLDFGGRSRRETFGGEVMLTIQAARHARRHLRRWMRPERAPTPLHLLPATCRVERQPKGVVGIIAPWNYPVLMALGPAVAALAAGNRVIVKVSEMAPATATLLRDLVAEAFPEDRFAVVLGGPDVGAAFSRQPFDHILFTGSTSVGRKIAAAAAENLVPLTLELGGKSPVWIGPDHPVEHAADRVAFGKIFNAGQTCIAPDTILCPEDRVDAFVEAYRGAMARMLPTLVSNPDWTSIISDRHRARLQALLDEAATGGARVIEINPAGERFDPSRTRKMAPTVVLGATDAMGLMQDEIFGPILPIVPVRGIDHAIRWVQERPRPLAMYLFDRDRERLREWTTRTHAGGVTFNDTLMHILVDDLPFGGSGPSGLGAYHGETGFLAFSHRKSVFDQSRVSFSWLFNQPYGAIYDRITSWLS